ncbi:MAG: hypothetical protein FWE57_04240 [Chitinispirillia bacterium]|nr:hypothetical protein [Chitinispirillia bacterium]
MFANSFLAQIDISDIQSEGMQLIAESCGIPDALTLMEKLPGLDLYVPAAAKKYYDWVCVHKNYTGYNAATLAGHLRLNREDVIRISRQPPPMSDHAANDCLILVKEKCGEDIAVRLIQNFPGYRFYIPINGLSTAIKKYIEREFKGTNAKELALNCGVSERHVRKIIREMYDNKAQLSLFGDQL